jgi:general secretion pathway protein K
MNVRHVRCAYAARRQGVALIVVLWMVMVLSLLVSGFAFTMHVETQVASFNRKELKAEMLARSGVEVARLQLILQQKSVTKAPYDAYNQPWATNEEFYVNHELGAGMFNVKVTDEEGKLPINRLSQQQLERLCAALGIDVVDADVIVDSILDWMDDNDLHRLNGAEDEYYESLSPPYKAKNGPLDRVEELLLVRGITPEIFYGTRTTEDDVGVPGFSDLLTTTSSGKVNVNTASPIVLEVLLGLDETQIKGLLLRRDGPDGVPGTEDDNPFASVGDFFGQVGGVTAEARQGLENLLDVKSRFFNVTSTGEVSGVKRTVVATLVRRDDGQVMIVTWRESRGGK